MNELQLFDEEKTMTVKEVAEAFGVTDRVIRKHAATLGLTENGKQTKLTEKQVTMIKNMIGIHDLERSFQLDNVNSDYEMMMLDKKVSEWKTAKIKELESQLEKAQPKIEFYDTVATSETAFDMAMSAKLLKLPYGRNTLFAKLREEKILRHNNEPYQKYIDLGYFRVIEESWKDSKGNVYLRPKTLVFQKGLAFIQRTIKA